MGPFILGPPFKSPALPHGLRLRSPLNTASSQKTSYWVGGSGNVTDAANHWSNVSGGTPGAQWLPDQNTDAIFDANSGANATITVNSAFSCRDFDMRACAATPTLAGSAAVNVFGNYALKAGMTYTYDGALVFAATATGKTQQWNGVQVDGTLSWNGVGGGWTWLDAMSTKNNTTPQLINGTLSTGGFSYTGGRFHGAASGTWTLNAGATVFTLSSLSSAWQMNSNGTTRVANLSSATVTISGSSTTMIFGTATYGAVNLTTTNNTYACQVSGSTFGNLTLLGAASKLDGFTFDASFSVTGTLKYLGNSANNRLLVQSSVRGTSCTITAAAIDATSNFTDFMDITGAGAAAPFATGSSIGDALGNSSITFTPAEDHYWVAFSGGNWDATTSWSLTSGGASGARVPLPQDDVFINAASITSGGRTITMNQPRLGKNITFAGVLNAPTVSMSVSADVFGSIAFSSGIGTFNPLALLLRGRSVHTITSAGKAVQNVVLVGPGSTYTLLDALNSTSVLDFQYGTFDANDFNVTADSARADNIATTKTVDFGDGTWTLTGSNVIGQTFRFGNAAAVVVIPGSSTIKFTNTTSVVKTFDGGGKIYNNLWFAATRGNLVISGANTFNDLKINQGLVAQLPAGLANTVASFSPQGVAAGAGDVKFANGFGTVGGRIETPDSVANSIAVDLDLQVLAQPSSWTAPGGSINILIAKFKTSGQYSWEFYIAADGRLGFVSSANGTTFPVNVVSTVSSSTVFGVGTLGWVRATLALATGQATFFTAPDVSGSPGAWTQLGALPVAAGATTIFDGTDPVSVIERGDATSEFNGRILRAMVFAGIAGVLKVDFNPNDYTTGTTWVSSGTGETWTINGNALISATNLVGLASSSATNATLAKTGGGTVDVAYLSVNRSTASPVNTFYADTSLDQGNNVAWSFLPRIIGTSDLVSQDATLSGAGESAWVGSGILVAQASTLTGTAAGSSDGVGALVVGTASASGLGVSSTVSSGALDAQSAVVTGGGISATVGFGALVDDASVVLGDAFIYVPAPYIATPIVGVVPSHTITGVVLAATSTAGVVGGPPATIIGVVPSENVAGVVAGPATIIGVVR